MPNSYRESSLTTRFQSKQMSDTHTYTHLNTPAHTHTVVCTSCIAQHVFHFECKQNSNTQNILLENCFPFGKSNSNSYQQWQLATGNRSNQEKNRKALLTATGTQVEPAEETKTSGASRGQRGRAMGKAKGTGSGERGCGKPNEERQTFDVAICNSSRKRSEQIFPFSFRFSSSFFWLY